MQENSGFNGNRWDLDEGKDGRGLSQTVIRFALWAASCLLIASLAPTAFVLPVFRDLLLFAAMTTSVVSVLRGESITAETSNGHDVVLLLLALALACGLFIDPEALLQLQRSS